MEQKKEIWAVYLLALDLESKVKYGQMLVIL